MIINHEPKLPGNKEIHNHLCWSTTQLVTKMNCTNISWGIKVAGAYGWKSYRFHVPIVMKSGSLNHLEPSGPVQACTGITLA